jgi:hypothetical protein
MKPAEYSHGKAGGSKTKSGTHKETRFLAEIEGLMTS